MEDHSHLDSLVCLVGVLESLFRTTMVDSQDTHFELKGYGVLWGTPIWRKGRIRLEA